MEAGARATIDDALLRQRLRRDFASSYTRRSYARPHPVLISDVTLRRYPVSAQRLFPQTSKSLSGFMSPADLPSLCPQVSKQSGPASTLKHNSSTGLLAIGNKKIRHKRHLRLKQKSKLQVALIVFSVLIIMAGGYVSYVGLRATHLAVVQATKLTQQVNYVAKSPTKSIAPSTIKPTLAAVANYVVAPTLPRYIIIPKLGVDAEVRSAGLTNNGALAVPDNVYYTDWYNESSLPGQQGAMLIDGHVSSWTAHGVFYGIKTLVAGDEIKIERGDGTIFTYKVVKNQIFPSGNVNMVSAMTPVVAGQPGLNLITCTGDVVPGTSEFNERIVVYATLN